MNPALGKSAIPIILCLLLCSCAQTGPPLPPSLELPKPPTDLRAARKGNRVTLSWSEPTLTTDRQAIRYVGPTVVCRSLEAEITSCKDPVTLLPAPTTVLPRTSRRRAKRSTNPTRPQPQIYVDTLPANLLQTDPTAEFTYAVEVLNRNARGAGLSNRVHVPAIATIPPPSDLSAALTGDGVLLSWTIPAGIRSEPGNRGLLLRYRIYRRDEGSGKDVIAGEVPINGPGRLGFTDSGFEWEKTYLYHVTGVTIIQRPDSEIQVEGDDTAPVRVVAHDVFPPSVPTDLQAAYSGEGQKPFIDLIWAPVMNADLAGYNVYRRETNGAAIRLNSEPVKTPAYRDTAVTRGKMYFYTLSAVDVRGNESQRSEETSESVP